VEARSAIEGASKEFTESPAEEATDRDRPVVGGYYETMSHRYWGSAVPTLVCLTFGCECGDAGALARLEPDNQISMSARIGSRLMEFQLGQRRGSLLALRIVVAVRLLS